MKTSFNWFPRFAWEPTRWPSVAAAIVAALGTAISSAAEPDKPAAKRLLAATVNGRPIYRAEVKRELRRALQDRKVDEASMPRLRAETLELLIDRRLVQEYFDRKRIGATAGEVDLAVRGFEAQLARTKQTLADHLEETGETEAELRRRIAWRISWQRHVSKHVTDDVLEKYFTQHRGDYDGTEIRVSHVLLRPARPGNEAELATLVKKAETIRREITQQKTTFAEACGKYSDAPSKDTGGDMGFIARHGQNVEAFSRAAFALDPGEISPAVVSPFGVHLIRCTEVRRGEKKWTDVRDALRRAVTAELFRVRARAARKNAKIEMAPE